MATLATLAAFALLSPLTTLATLSGSIGTHLLIHRDEFFLGQHAVFIGVRLVEHRGGVGHLATAAFATWTAALAALTALSAGFTGSLALFFAELAVAVSVELLQHSLPHILATASSPAFAAWLGECWGGNNSHRYCKYDCTHGFNPRC